MVPPCWRRPRSWSLLATWAAAIGPDRVFGSDPRPGRPPARRSGRPRRRPVRSRRGGRGGRGEGLGDHRDPRCRDRAAGGARLPRWCWSLRWVRSEATEDRRRRRRRRVEFEVLPATPEQAAEEMVRDADQQLALLREGSPRNGIVACWHRFEVQAEAVGIGRAAVGDLRGVHAARPRPGLRRRARGRGAVGALPRGAVLRPRPRRGRPRGRRRRARADPSRPRRSVRRRAVVTGGRWWLRLVVLVASAVAVLWIGDAARDGPRPGAGGADHRGGRGPGRPAARRRATAGARMAAGGGARRRLPPARPADRGQPADPRAPPGDEHGRLGAARPARGPGRAGAAGPRTASTPRPPGPTS